MPNQAKPQPKRSGDGQSRGINKPRRKSGPKDALGSLRQEVYDFTQDSLRTTSKTDYNKFRKERLVKLGATKIQKSEKMPYKLLMERRRQAAEREKMAQDREEIRKRFHNSELKKKVDTDFAAFNQLVGNRRGDKDGIGDGSKGFKPTLGKFKNGALVLSQKDIYRATHPNAQQEKETKKDKKKGGGKGGKKKGGNKKKK